MTRVPLPEPASLGTTTGWLRTGSTEPCRRNAPGAADARAGGPPMVAPSARRQKLTITARMLE
jgi:hypothetical protein